MKFSPVCYAVAAAIACTAVAKEPVEAKAKPAAPDKSATAWAPAVNPKPLSNEAKRGLQWLVASQLPGGGWSQGEESATMGSGMKDLKGEPNVADTCVSTLALLREGSTPGKGAYADSISKGLDFICREIEGCNDETLFITKIRGTRVQAKLGTYIDTFLASMVLAEVKDKMPDEKSRKRIVAALDRVMDKIEKNQRPDGGFGGQGWATALSQSMASKGVNRAAQSGAKVSESTREKLENYGGRQYDAKSKKFGSGGTAGVELYGAGSALSALQDSDNTNEARREELEKQAKEGTTTKERDKAKNELTRYDANKRQLAEARSAVVERLGDKQFMSGFGSNGGEEFLSYMNIGESLVVKGGDEWYKWDKSMTENLNRIQNKDGSWTGHHCITGRNFCTSAALLVLMVDRAPVPVAASMGRR